MACAIAHLSPCFGVPLVMSSSVMFIVKSSSKNVLIVFSPKQRGSSPSCHPHLLNNLLPSIMIPVSDSIVHVAMR